MAVVKTYQFDGKTVQMADDFYRDVSKEEILQRIRQFQEAAGALLYRQQKAMEGKGTVG